MSRPPAPPSGLRQRGKRLWRDVVSDKGSLTGGERVMLHEACRLADRLDQFDRLLRGEIDTWASIRDRDGELELMINSAATEARQTAGQLRQHIVALGLAATSAAADAGPKGGGILDELAAKRDDRRSGTAGS